MSVKQRENFRPTAGTTETPPSIESDVAVPNENSLDEDELLRQEVLHKQKIIELVRQVDVVTFKAVLGFIDQAFSYELKMDQGNGGHGPDAGSLQRMADKVRNDAVVSLVRRLGSYQAAELWVKEFIQAQTELGIIWDELQARSTD
jgi:hypothetical protein